ncbi:MAG TPA: hypothetical protein VLE72_00065 [Candidatus Saccharimonadales bacterium]|nr:hypothetical protein [Candidatus Saccharimonadales bacterium]
MSHARYRIADGCFIAIFGVIFGFLVLAGFGVSFGLRGLDHFARFIAFVVAAECIVVAFIVMKDRWQRRVEQTSR